MAHIAHQVLKSWQYVIYTVSFFMLNRLFSNCFLISLWWGVSFIAQCRQLNKIHQGEYAQNSRCALGQLAVGYQKNTSASDSFGEDKFHLLPDTTASNKLHHFDGVKFKLNDAQPEVLSACIDNFNILLPGKLNDPAAIYQWEIYANGLWNPLPLATNYDYIALTPPAVGNIIQTISYRCKVTLNNAVTYLPYYDVNYYPLLSDNKITADKTFICTGDDGKINITGNTPGEGLANETGTYQWQQSNDNSSWTIIDGAVQQNYNYQFTGIGSVFIRRRAVRGGCSNFSNTVKIQHSLSLTNANAGNNQTICGTTQANLMANTPAMDEIGTWSVISPANYSPFTSANVNNPNAVITGLPVDLPVLLQWAITKSGCSIAASLATTSVTVNSLPIVTTGDDVSINKGESVTLNGTIEGDYTGGFLWSPASGLDNINVLNTVASPSVTTTFTLTAKNASGCSVFASVTVVIKNQQIIVPNAFTPNNDGVNDRWDIQNLNTYDNTSVVVFNRNGGQVFSSRGHYTPWNGTFNGKKLPLGVYYYIIAVKNPYIKKAGYLTILY